MKKWIIILFIMLASIFFVFGLPDVQAPDDNITEIVKNDNKLKNGKSNAKILSY